MDDEVQPKQKGGEAFLGVLKDEEEKKEEEMEQKMREEKEFKIDTYLNLIALK